MPSYTRQAASCLERYRHGTFVEVLKQIILEFSIKDSTQFAWSIGSGIVMDGIFRPRLKDLVVAVSLIDNLASKVVIFVNTLSMSHNVGGSGINSSYLSCK